MVVSRVCLESSFCYVRLMGLFQSLLAAQFTDSVHLVNPYNTAWLMGLASSSGSFSELELLPHKHKADRRTSTKQTDRTDHRKRETAVQSGKYLLIIK